MSPYRYVETSALLRVFLEGDDTLPASRCCWRARATRPR